MNKKVIIDAILKFSAEGVSKALNKIKEPLKRVASAPGDVLGKITSNAGVQNSLKKAFSLPDYVFGGISNDIIKAGTKIGQLLKNVFTPKDINKEITSAAEKVTRIQKSVLTPKESLFKGITSTVNRISGAIKKIFMPKGVKKLKDDLEDILKELGKINKTKVKPKVDTSQISAAKKTIADFSATISSALAATIAYTTKQSIEEIRDLVITQTELQNIFKSSSVSILDVTSKLQYLTGQSIPELTDAVRNSAQYFDNEKEALAGIYLSAMVASTGVADFNVVLRNLGAASRGMLSPILSKFFGRQIGVNFNDAQGNAISFGKALEEIYNKYGKLKGAVQQTPWWVFRQLRNQLNTTFRSLERPVVENFANSLRTLINRWYKFNELLDLSSKYSSTIIKLSKVSQGMNITPSPKAKATILDIQKKIDKLQKLEISNTEESIKKANKLKEQIADEVDSLSKGNVSIRNFKDNLGNTLKISEMNSMQFQSLLDSIKRAGGDLDTLNDKLEEMLSKSKNIKRALTLGLAFLTPYLIKLGGVGVSRLFGASAIGKLGSAIAAPMQVITKSFGAYSLAFLVAIELFRVFKNNVDGARDSLHAFSLTIKEAYKFKPNEAVQNISSSFKSVWKSIDEFTAGIAKSAIYIGSAISTIPAIIWDALTFNGAKIVKDWQRFRTLLSSAWYAMLVGLGKVLMSTAYIPGALAVAGITAGFNYLKDGFHSINKKMGILLNEIGDNIKNDLLHVAEKIKAGFEILWIRIKEGLYIISHPKANIKKVKERYNEEINGVNKALTKNLAKLDTDLANKLKKSSKDNKKAIDELKPWGYYLDNAILSISTHVDGAKRFWDKFQGDLDARLKKLGFTSKQIQKIAKESKSPFEELIKSLYGLNKPVYAKPSESALKTLYNLLQSFYDKLASLTLPKNILNIYKISNDIARFAPLVKNGLIKPIDLATLAFKELKSAASQALHATYYGIKENPLTKELKHIEGMATKELNVNQIIRIILDSTKLKEKAMPAQDYATLEALVRELTPYLIAAMQGKATSQIFNFSLGTTTSP